MDKDKELLLPANRQYRHNSEDGFLQGYDVYETRKIVASLLAEIEELRRGRDEVVHDLALVVNNSAEIAANQYCAGMDEKKRADEAESRTAALQKERDDAVAWVKQVRGICREISEIAVAEADIAPISHDRANYRKIRDISKGLISLPLPGSAERMREEVRREAFREALTLITPATHLCEYKGSLESFIAKYKSLLRTACPEKGGETS